tara:strand:+ start:642 stop:1037 length:396 start_codon:yes stop_codon:yes gene_type:complete
MNFFLIIIKLIRNVLGKTIYFFDFIFPPVKIKRSPVEQIKIDLILKSYALYQYKLCPFCVKVRRFLKKYNLKLEFKDPSIETLSRKELLEKGGKLKVPCLRIIKNGKIEWLYESTEIIKFLKKIARNLNCY